MTAILSGFREGVEYEIDDDRRGVAFTDAGLARLERELGTDDLYAPEQIGVLTAAHVALHAHALVERDVHYFVVDGRVQLVDDARGCIADRQRWPDGLQAAIERKEGVAVTTQAELLDQILVESVVRAYRSIAGMSGTAREAAGRLAEDLELDTGVIPPHRACIRQDHPDRLFRTADERDRAAVAEIRAAHDAGQPVLIGTARVAASERFAELLAAEGVAATVLNAKNDAAEADIIARAGERGSVTVSTQMSGRGVDIRLGPGAAEAGGLLVVGIGRYPSARLDRQLRGRSGRQGDPGRSVFFTSLDDPIVRAQAGDAPRIRETGEIRDPAAARFVEHAQRVAEGEALQLHRTTRSYHTLTDRHRRILLRTRDRILDDADGLRAYLELVWPEDPQRVAHWIREPRRALAVVREGIHLRVLARQNPLEAYRRIAADAFGKVGPRVAERVRAQLDSAPDDASLADLGLRRPPSAWTYMVTDNPFGSEIDRVVAFFGKYLRPGRG